MVEKFQINELGFSTRIEHLFSRHGLHTTIDIFKMWGDDYPTILTGILVIPGLLRGGLAALYSPLYAECAKSKNPQG